MQEHSSGKQVQITRRRFAPPLNAGSQAAEGRLREVLVDEVRRPRRCTESREPPLTTVVRVRIYRAYVEDIVRLSTGHVRERLTGKKHRTNTYPNGAVREIKTWREKLPDEDLAP